MESDKIVTKYQENFAELIEPGKQFSAGMSFMGNEFGAFSFGKELDIKYARPATHEMDGTLYEFMRISFVSQEHFL